MSLNAMAWKLLIGSGSHFSHYYIGQSKSCDHILLQGQGIYNSIMVSREDSEKYERINVMSWLIICVFSYINGLFILCHVKGGNDSEKKKRKKKKHNILYLMLFSENIRHSCHHPMEFFSGSPSPSTNSKSALIWKYFGLCLHFSFLLSHNDKLEKCLIILSSFSTMRHCFPGFCL